jgi:hypothetical protein
MHILAKCRLSWNVGLISTQKQTRELISGPSSAAKTRLIYLLHGAESFLRS